MKKKRRERKAKTHKEKKKTLDLLFVEFTGFCSYVVGLGPWCMCSRLPGQFFHEGQCELLSFPGLGQPG